jgi:uncharacterized protein YukJ
MPIDNYGVFKGRAISRRLATGSSPHYQIQLVDESGTHFRVAINVLSQTAPSEVMFYMKPFFMPPLTARVKELSFIVYGGCLHEESLSCNANERRDSYRGCK